MSRYWKIKKILPKFILTCTNLIYSTCNVTLIQIFNSHTTSTVTAELRVQIGQQCVAAVFNDV